MFSPGSIIFLILLILCFRSTNVLLNLLLLTIFFELEIEVGCLIKIGASKVMYRQASEIILFLYSFSCMIKEPVKYVNPLIVCCLCIPIISLISLLLFPSDVLVGTHTVTLDHFFCEGDALLSPHPNKIVYQNTVFSIMSVVDLSVIYKKFSIKDYIILLFKSYRFILLFVFLGFSEFILKYLFKTVERWGSITTFLWGEGSIYALGGRERGNGYELSLFTLEASHYAYVLMISAIVILAVNHLRNKPFVTPLFLVVVFLMIASTSFSSIMYLFFLGIIILYYRWYVVKTRFKTVEQFLIVLFLVFLLSLWAWIPYLENSDFFLAERLLKVSNELTSFSLQDVDLSDTADGSTRIRLYSIVLALNSVFFRPIFGHGADAVYCHGSFAMLLSGFGLVGTFFWVKLMFGTLHNKINVSINEMGYSCIVFSLLVTYLFLTLGMRPFIEFSFILISFSLVAICSGKLQLKKKFMNYILQNKTKKEKTNKDINAFN